MEVAARMVARGDMDHGEAVDRVALLERRDQDRELPFDPVHHLPIRPAGMLESMERDDALDRRIAGKLDAALDRLDAAVRASPARVHAERQSGAARA